MEHVKDGGNARNASLLKWLDGRVVVRLTVEADPSLAIQWTRRFFGNVVLALAVGLASPAPVAAQQSAEAPADSQTARRDAVQLVRDAYPAAVRARPARTLPIGVFDSGTGGLAVLEEILRLDQFDNETGAPRSGGDGRPDFADEQFVFLADQANMPYGNYPAAGKRSLLVELVLKDSLFLLGAAYAEGPPANVPVRGRTPVKAIVIACNTATAYGEAEVEQLIREAGIDVPVISVIEAGAEATIEALSFTGEGAVGVLATCGTVASGAYPEAIAAVARQRGRKPPCVVQQGSVGLAGAIDGLPEFVLSPAGAGQPRRDYLGPSLVHEQAPIAPAMLPRYGFDFSQGGMIWEGTPAQPTALQINSVQNHVAYETVSLLEKLRREPDAQPLVAVVLGCTHFPYVAQVFRDKLRQLYNYQENGRYVYRRLLAPDVSCIDPGQHVARRLYAALAAGSKRREAADAKLQPTRGQFYITVPNRDHPGVQLAPHGGFTQEYKYGRTRTLGMADVHIVPLTPQLLPADVAGRLERRLPEGWRLLQDFTAHRGS